MVLGTFPLLYNHYHHPSPELFHSQTESPPPLSNTFHIPSPQTLATTILLSVSMSLPTLGTSYNWDQTIRVLLSLAYFKVHPCCSMCLKIRSISCINCSGIQCVSLDMFGMLYFNYFDRDF